MPLTPAPDLWSRTPPSGSGFRDPYRTLTYGYKMATYGSRYSYGQALFSEDPGTPSPPSILFVDKLKPTINFGNSQTL